MSKKLIKLLFLLLFAKFVFSQTTVGSYSLEGFILNTSNEPMQGAHVYVQETGEQTLTSAEGKFRFSGLNPGVYRLHVSYIGYQCIHPYKLEIIDESISVSVIMEAVGQTLDEVVVEADYTQLSRKTTQTVVNTGERYIRENRGSSLMASLEKLPGVQAMSIGQGLSKPMIRGLSFNRVAVSENNIKMEGQQWGADHGLEIDQFGVEQIEIIKGPSSLRFGSDALGGLVQIKPHALAAPDRLETEAGFFARSVNQLLGYSFRSRLRKKQFFAYARFTHTRFSDYTLPADSFYYNRYRFAIPDKKLKNTAGIEQNAYLTAGWLDDW